MPETRRERNIRDVRRVEVEEEEIDIQEVEEEEEDEDTYSSNTKSKGPSLSANYKNTAQVNKIAKVYVSDPDSPKIIFAFDFVESHGYVIRSVIELIHRLFTCDIPVYITEQGINIFMKTNSGGKEKEKVYMNVNLYGEKMYRFSYNKNKWNCTDRFSVPGHFISLNLNDFYPKAKGITKTQGFKIFEVDGLDKTIFCNKYGGKLPSTEPFRYSDGMPSDETIDDGYVEGKSIAVKIPIIQFVAVCNTLHKSKTSNKCVFVCTEDWVQICESGENCIKDVIGEWGKVKEINSVFKDDDERRYSTHVSKAILKGLSELGNCCNSYVNVFSNENGQLRLSLDLMTAGGDMVINIKNTVT